MKLLLALACVLSALAATGFLLFGSPAPQAQEQTLSLPSDEGLTARIDAVVEENRRLRDRISMLEARPMETQRAPITEDFVTRAELEALRQELLAQAADSGAQSADPLRWKAQVAEALTQVRKDEAVQSTRNFQEKRLARLDDDLLIVQAKLQLEPSQTSALRPVLQAAYDREAEVRRLWESGVDPQMLADRKAGDLEMFRTDIGRVLTPTQLDTYWATFSRAGK
jgi:hypothetical protein